MVIIISIDEYHLGESNRDERREVMRRENILASNAAHGGHNASHRIISHHIAHSLTLTLTLVHYVFNTNNTSISLSLFLSASSLTAQLLLLTHIRINKTFPTNF